MSDSNSDNGWIWWILAFTILGGILFVFNKELWPQLESPVLRCLIAPFAGLVLTIAGLVIMYFYSGAWIPGLAQVIWNFVRWLTSPILVLLICMLLLVSGGLALLVGWASWPMVPIWATIGGITVGTLSGFIALRIASIAPHRIWHVKAIVAFPVSAGAAYWATIKLMAAPDPVWYRLAIILAAALLGRILWEEQSVPSQAHQTSVHQQYSLRASDLPENLREQLLARIREQLGEPQYNHLIDTMGEDGVIDLVLKRTSKTQ